MLVALPACRLILSNIRDEEVRDEDGYTVFEPDVTLEVQGRNAFAPFGWQRVPVVIMHAREVWLRETHNLLRHMDQGLEDEKEDEYVYPLFGTQMSIRLVRPGTGAFVKVFIDRDELRGWMAGEVSVRDWVAAMAGVSREMSDLFHRLHPSLFEDPLFVKQELLLQEIESWLIAHDKS